MWSGYLYVVPPPLSPSTRTKIVSRSLPGSSKERDNGIDSDPPGAIDPISSARTFSIAEPCSRMYRSVTSTVEELPERLETVVSTVTSSPGIGSSGVTETDVIWISAEAAETVIAPMLSPNTSTTMLRPIVSGFGDVISSQMS